MQPFDPHQIATIRSRVRVVRSLATLSLLGVLIPWYVYLLRDPFSDRVGLLVPLFIAPLWSPLIWIVFRLTSDVDSSIYKRALALAIGWSSAAAMFASFAVYLTIDSGENRWKYATFFTAFALLQLAVVFASIEAYYSFPREKEDRKILLWRFGMSLSVLLLCLAVPQLLVSKKIVSPEAIAIGSLRNVNTAQSVYASNHPDKGFAASLQDLGPSPGAELIDASLARGKKSGYIIEMYAPRAPHGRIARYTLIARPERFGKDGTRSFLTDESGIFHVTLENRPPTRLDPLL